MTPKSLVGFEERLLQADGSNPFRALSSSIIYQQISGKAAASIRAKFIALFDAPVPTDEGSTWFPTPEMVLDKTPEELRSAGLSGRKAEYIRDLAIKFVDKTIQPDLLDAMSDEEISKQLCSVKGIGQWTVDMYLMFNMRHPDVLPVTDLGIRKGLALHFNIPKGTTKRDTLPTPEQMRQVTEIWRPYRTLGCWYMWLLTDIYTVAD
ncbi:DNA glycosylase [Radiomyces spectabilis]|uniref:DNA glycosylase n=1 Tax=Radiomyces spectabilis TaxID=64574 RepID=UPI00221FB31D|nr:DNA glycosylase [Radiomyces spectabilis]KAI8369315.1 DNA glycosylase [Radiomyces spectabilis]